jgi:hypothetical protein
MNLTPLDYPEREQWIEAALVVACAAVNYVANPTNELLLNRLAHTVHDERFAWAIYQAPHEARKAG